MNLRTLGIAVLAATVLATPSFAQTFVEIEPNSGKSEATSVIGIVAGDTIGGTTTGTDITLGSTLDGTMDYFRVKVGALPVGLYKHRLSLATSGAGGHLGAIRGLNQTGTAGVGGVIGTVDNTAQSASINTALLFNQWYGFGKQEEIYWRIQGTGTSTAPYVATMSTSVVTPTTITPSFESSSPITISTVGLTVNDTHVHLYDSNFDPVLNGSNDDVYPPAIAPDNLNSKLTRTLAPGTYYIAMSRNNTAWNLPATFDDNYVLGTVMDFPDCLVRAITTSGPAQDWSFTVSSSNGTYNQTNLIPANNYYEVTWFKITVASGAPPVVTPNDACASAIDVGTGGTDTGSFLNATNDGAASCDPGGAASRDVWYKITNPSAVVRTLFADTCTSSSDTVLSIHASCGGAELACNDDCGGTPCVATSSCISMNLNPGQTVFIRLSDKGIGVGQPYVLHTSLLYANDDCSTPISLAVPGLYPFDTDGATTGVQGQLEALCLLPPGGTGIGKDLWYTYTGTLNGTATVSTCNLLTGPFFDTKISIYPGAGCPASSSIACWDDDGAGCGQSPLETTISWPTTCGQSYTIQLGGFSFFNDLTGNFLLSEVGSACVTPSVAYCSGDGTDATCPCANPGAPGKGCDNTVASGGAGLSVSGIASISADTLVLHGDNAVPFGPGLYYQGSLTANPVAPFGIPFGNGLRCAGGATPRLEIRGANALGASSTTVAIHLLGSDSAGDVRNYQLWYRDSPVFGSCLAGFNLSSALTLTWVP